MNPGAKKIMSTSFNSMYQPVMSEHWQSLRKSFYFDVEFQGPIQVDKMSRDPVGGLFPRQEVMEKLGAVSSIREAMML